MYASPIVSTCERKQYPSEVRTGKAAVKLLHCPRTRRSHRIVGRRAAPTAYLVHLMNVGERIKLNVKTIQQSNYVHGHDGFIAAEGREAYDVREQTRNHGELFGFDGKVFQKTMRYFGGKYRTDKILGAFFVIPEFCFENLSVSQQAFITEGEPA